MKIKFWMVAWCAILAVCVAKGIATRASFTTLLAGSSEVLNSYYEYSVDQIVKPELFSHTTYAALASQSKLILLHRETPDQERLSSVTSAGLKCRKREPSPYYNIYEPDTVNLFHCERLNSHIPGAYAITRNNSYWNRNGK